MEKEVLQAISQSLESLSSMVKHLYARMNALEDRAAKPVAKVRNGEKSPLVVRHSRYSDEFGEIHAKGGVTYLFELNYKNRTVKVGVAVCSQKENFEKYIGRKLAEERLKTDPIIFPYSAPSNVGLVDAFWDAVNNGDVRMSEGNRRILSSIKTSDLLL